MKQQHTHSRGFSLLELLLVVVLIGVIASIVMVRISQNADTAKSRTCFHNRSELNTAIERWYVENDAWPAADLSDLGADVNYFPSGIPVCPATGNSYSMNTTTHRVNGHTSAALPGNH
jgi:prepilin-type N-terminal cleavage/methylation domain-containing protein